MRAISERIIIRLNFCFAEAIKEHRAKQPQMILLLNTISVLTAYVPIRETLNDLTDHMATENCHSRHLLLMEVLNYIDYTSQNCRCYGYAARC